MNDELTEYEKEQIAEFERMERLEKVTSEQKLKNQQNQHDQDHPSPDIEMGNINEGVQAASVVADGQQNAQPSQPQVPRRLQDMNQQ